MLGEINRDWYCTANRFKDGICNLCKNGGSATFYCEKSCSCCHRKHPTPEQFLAEYGFAYPDDGAVYLLKHRNSYPHYKEWEIFTYGFVKSLNNLEPIICACTPWGRPSDDWRPK